MKINRSNIDVLVRGVLVEQNRTTSKMCHIEPIRQVLVVKIFNCSLQGDDMPLPCNVFFDGSSCASRSLVPVVNAEPFLFSRASGNIGVEAVFLFGWRMLPYWCLAKRRISALAPTMWRCRMVSGSDFTQAENPPRMDDTSSS